MIGIIISSSHVVLLVILGFMVQIWRGMTPVSQPTVTAHNSVSAATGSSSLSSTPTLTGAGQTHCMQCTISLGLVAGTNYKQPLPSFGLQQKRGRGSRDVLNPDPSHPRGQSAVSSQPK